MGRGTIIECDKCKKYEEEILFGTGFYGDPFMYMNPPSVEPNHWDVVESKRIRDKIEDLIKNKHGIVLFENRNNDEEIEEDECIFGYRAYYSETEKKVYNLFYFQISYYENGVYKIYEPDYKDKSKKLLRLINYFELFNVDLICPKCGQKIERDLTKEGFVIINWD